MKNSINSEVNAKAEQIGTTFVLMPEPPSNARDDALPKIFFHSLAADFIIGK